MHLYAECHNDLASFVHYTDPFSVETGNQFLKPMITNNVRIGYHYLNHMFSILLDILAHTDPSRLN
ncbi:outer membrane beta-barrel protein [Olivibacter sitiensis]|uniref:outer membrane beta-barrel protein n=1 Tax=Olivibacter sitiensis TaxID=376470 RepID=UPI0012FA788D